MKFILQRKKVNGLGFVGIVSVDMKTAPYLIYFKHRYNILDLPDVTLTLMYEFIPILKINRIPGFKTGRRQSIPISRQILSKTFLRFKSDYLVTVKDNLKQVCEKVI